ncbi:hypothetical protein FRB90_000862, partial [Tulasnella sp. 427]
MPPGLTTATTAASSSLPVTPATPYLGRFSTARSYQPGLPDHRELEEPRSAGSNFQFAFRPPSEPAGRAELTTAASASTAASTGGGRLATHWEPLSTPSFVTDDCSKTIALSGPSSPASPSEKTLKALTPSVSGSE